MAAIYRDRIPREKALEVLARGGKLSQADYLRYKVRYFSDGAVIGGKAFVDEMFAAFRHRFGPKRKDGARPLRGLAGKAKEDRLFNLRQLRTAVFGLVHELQPSARENCACTRELAKANFIRDA